MPGRPPVDGRNRAVYDVLSTLKNLDCDSRVELLVSDVDDSSTKQPTITCLGLWSHSNILGYG